MENNLFTRSANRLEAHLGKNAHEFTKDDIKQVVEDLNIKMVNFIVSCWWWTIENIEFHAPHPRLLGDILTSGERVDGSSLFSFIAAGSSDLYVMPRFSTAFIDPFSEIPTLCMLCSFLRSWRQSVSFITWVHAPKGYGCLLRKWQGMEFQAMGE